MKKALLALVLGVVLAGGVQAQNRDDDQYSDHYDRFEFQPDTLVLSRSVYVGKASTLVPGETALPPVCPSGTVNVALLAGSTTPITLPSGNGSGGCATAVVDGTYPYVFNNDTTDGSFGVSSPILLDDITTDGHVLGTLPIPSDQLVTSFSSKSELAVNLSTDGKSVTFSGYRGGPGYPTGVNLFDISDSNTPGVIDPTNPVGSQYYRTVAEIDAHGHMMFTEGNGYSGDNGRAAIKGDSLYYLAGNDNNGALSKSQLTTTVAGSYLVQDTSAQLLVPGQTPPVPPNFQMIGDFSIGQVIDPATGKLYTLKDKPGKDNNFRGITIFNNTLYVSKGSGSNGINTVYQVGTAGTLPSGPESTLETLPITVLPGLPAVPASGTDGGNTVLVRYPFGMWFANANTLYVADEGDGCTAYAAAPSPCTDIAQTGTPTEIGDSIYTHAATTNVTAGLEKWVYDSTTSQWNLAYTIQSGLKLGVPQTIPGYPTGINDGTAGTNLPWAPATDGLRNLTGRVNRDGTVTIWAVTSTVSGSGDQGADPDQLVRVTDKLDATSLPTDPSWLDHFETIRAAHAGELFRGVAFAPQDGDYQSDDHHNDGHEESNWR